VLEPSKWGISRVVVWGSELTMEALEDRPWLIKKNLLTLNKGLLRRTLWQRYSLSQSARDEGCSLLFVPGGSYAGNFHPVVTMSQNLLPFEMHELVRFGLSFISLKLLLLRLTQSFAFRQSDGLIFLTEYARDAVLSVTGKIRGESCIVPHGLNARFNKAPKLQRPITDYDDSTPYRVLYVSIIDQYKHQWHVVEAVAALRQQGFPVVLDLVGPAYPPALRRLTSAVERFDVDRAWVHYHGAIPFSELHLRYAQADLGVFASSCENMPNILLETMASGLPIACSNRGPMPEVLGDAGIYFDPEQPESIALALLTLIESPQMRSDLANASYARAQQYSWQRCANETFGFITAITHQYTGKRDV
jgi:glycosyltransferase involved in cell wall biosynthesis